jgi:hypothetical protein
MIATLVYSRFYGEVVLKFEAGNIVHIRRSQSSKIEDEARRLQGVEYAALAARSSNNTPKLD